MKKGKGELVVLPVGRLVVDHDYQRPLLAGYQIARLAKNWSDEACGVLTVMIRDGRYYVVDGQQRLAAAKKHGISELPCMVYQSEGKDKEASLFRQVNENRVAVPPIYKYRAAVMEGGPLESKIDEWCRAYGFAIQEHGPNGKSLSFVAAVLIAWKTDEEATKAAIKTQADVEPGRPQHSAVFKGLWWLERRGINTSAWADKLTRSGGQSAILNAIRAYEIASVSLRSQHQTACGLGVLAVINKGLRRKVAVGDER